MKNAAAPPVFFGGALTKAGTRDTIGRNLYRTGWLNAVTLTLKMFLIVCPMLFLTGFVDSIAGGGGLISLPAYLFAGLPVHMAIGTNKLSSACGTALTTARFIRGGHIRWRLALPGIAAAMIGSGLGSRLSLVTDEQIIRTVLFAVLPLAAFIVLNPRLFPEQEAQELRIDRRTVTVCILAALIIGFYDGFYGPGAGTFLIIAFTAFARLGVTTANAHAKAINLTTNITSLIVFLHGGTVLIPLGLAGAVFNTLGNYVGLSLALRGGAKITRPVILAVLALLLVKLLTE